MIEEIEDLRVQADKLGKIAGGIHDKLMEGVELPFIKRHELEVEMYDLRLRQSKLNLKFHQVLKWASQANHLLAAGKPLNFKTGER